MRQKQQLSNYCTLQYTATAQSNRPTGNEYEIPPTKLGFAKVGQCLNHNNRIAYMTTVQFRYICGSLARFRFSRFFL